MARHAETALWVAAALALAVVGVTAQCETTDVYFDVVWRDHHSGYPSSPSQRHPDFERSSYPTSTKNVVLQTLDANGKPTPNPSIWSLAENRRAFISNDSFYTWFNDGPFASGLKNIRVDGKMKWSRVSAGSAKFRTAAAQQTDGTNYFPLNGLGFNDYYTNGNNYAFTTELKFKFQYKGFESFTFSGDDDFWAFIEGYLVVDLGGLHSPESATISLPPNTKITSNTGVVQNLILIPGNEYTLSIFNAERHTTGSTFYAETTLYFSPTVTLSTESRDASFIVYKNIPRTVNITLSYQPDQDTTVTCRAADGSAVFTPITFPKCTTTRTMPMPVIFASANFVGAVVSCTANSTGIYSGVNSNNGTVKTLSKNPPTFINPPANATVSCTGVSTMPTLSTRDDCNNSTTVTQSETRTAGACTFQYLLTRTWTATDKCGNTATYTQVINVTDNVAPTFTSNVADQAVACGSTIPSPVTLTATDNCGGTVTLSATNETTTPGACPRNYTITRTVTARDECGNANTFRYYIYPFDATAPKFTSVPSDISVSCQSVPAGGILQAQETCAGTLFNVNPTDVTQAGSCANTYTIFRRWRAIAQCGGVTQYEQKISVSDREAPVLQNVPAPVTVKCTDPVPTAQVSAVDSCSGTPTVSFSETRTNSCATAYTLTRTWSAKDVCGNTSPTATQVVQVTDNVAPAISNVPLDATVSCEAVPAAPVNVAVKDDCDTAPKLTFDETKTAGNCPNRYTLKRTWSAVDACNNPSSASQTITVTDNVVPVLVGVPVNASATCLTLPNAPTVTATDNCGAASVTFSQSRTNGKCTNEFTLKRTWTATDACGLTATSTQTINVTDTAAPVFTSPPPAIIDAECSSIPAAPTLTATDECGSPVTVTMTTATNPGSCTSTYQIVRTYTATDECGNVATFVQTVNVKDTTKPVLSGVPANTAISCENPLPAATVTATDNCGSATVTYKETRTNGACAQSYTMNRTWTATDACGNTASLSQLVTVSDATPPVFSGAQSETIQFPFAQANTVPAIAAKTAQDNCFGAINVPGTETRVNGTCSNTFTLKRNWTAIDGCNNAATVTQTILVSDGRLPNVTGLPNPVDYSTKCSVAIVVPTVLGLNQSGQVVTVSGPTLQTINGACPGNFTRVHTWVANDACGNTQTFQQRVTAFDNEAPVLVGVPADATVACNAVPAAPTVTATDSCGTATVAFRETRVDGNCPWRFTLLRTWTATDQCGNVASKTQTITVASAAAPSFASTPTATVRAACSAIPAVPSLSATAVCGTATITFNEAKAAGSCGQAFTLTRTWTATDQCQNAATATQVVTIVDETKPTLVGVPANQNVACDRVPAENAVAVSAVDDCDIAPVVTVSTARMNGSCAHQYTLVRTWTAKDACGNTATASQTIGVQDAAGPVLSGIPEDRSDACDVVAVPPAVTATDACFGSVDVTMTQNDEPGACGGSFTRVYTWEATDGCGNVVRAEARNIVTDTKAPVINDVPTDSAMTCQDAWELESVEDEPVNVTDDCDPNPALITQETKMLGGCGSNFTLTRTFVAKDWCGNTATKTQTINVGDNAPPLFLGGAVFSDVALADCDLLPAAQDAIAIDYCDSSRDCIDNPVGEGCLGKIYARPSEVKSNFVCPNTYTLVRTFQAIDTCGNVGRIVQHINVVDRKRPEFFTVVPADATYECAAQVPAATASQMRASDRCDSSPAVTLSEDVKKTCDNRVNITRTWTATDSCGNKVAASQTVRVADYTAPVLSGLPGATSLTCSDPSLKTGPSMVSSRDLCDGSIAVTYSDAKENVLCTGNYTLRRTWSSADACGNAVSAERVVQVFDSVPPVLQGVPDDIFLTCGSSVPAAPVVTAVDECGTVVGNVEFTEDQPVFTCKQSFSVRRTWRAVDDCGNVALAVRFVYVADTVAPAFNATPNATIHSTSGVPPAPVLSATDDCSGAANVVLSETRENGSCPDSFVLTRRWTATDDCGNFNYVTQRVSVGDATPPVFVGEPIVHLKCGDPLPNVTVSDDGPVTPNVTVSRFNGACPNTYTVLRQFRAVDRCGNQAGLDQYLEYADSKAPVLSGVPADAAASCSAIPAPATVTATDDCDSPGNITITLTETKESVVCNGSYVLVRTWRAVDRCGNAAVGVQRITVSDTAAPVLLHVPADFSGECGVDIPNPVTAVDACSAAQLDLNVTVTFGGCAGNRTLTRVWTATDACGNVATASQRVRLHDTTPPRFVDAQQASVVVRCFDPRPSSALSAVDACDGVVTVALNETTDDTRNLTVTKGCPTNFHIFRKWNATDSCGNTARYNQLVTVMYTEYGYVDPNSLLFVSSGGGSNVGAIVGGIVGGVLLALLLVLIAGFLLRRRRREEEKPIPGSFAKMAGTSRPSVVAEMIVPPPPSAEAVIADAVAASESGARRPSFLEKIVPRRLSTLAGLPTEEEVHARQQNEVELRRTFTNLINMDQLGQIAEFKAAQDASANGPPGGLERMQSIPLDDLSVAASDV